MANFVAKSHGSVPFLDMQAGYLRHRFELDTAISEAILDSDFVLGRRTEQFERDFAEFCGTAHGVGCANGTDALEIAFEAAGIGQGDEVITVSHTFAASVSAILRVGATPVLVDVDPKTLLMNTAALEGAVTERTVAVLVVHLYGSVVPMQPVLDMAREHKLQVFEDAAQAHGARWQGRRAGSFGIISTFSFYPGKNLGAFGDGGMLMTDNEELATRARMIRDHGKSGKFIHEILGRNSRLDGLQAAVLSVKLRHLDEENAARRRVYRVYETLMLERVPQVELVSTPLEGEAVHHLLVAKVPDRDQVWDSLTNQGVGLGIHYPIPVHQQPAFADRVRTGGKLRITEQISNEILSLPMFPTISEAQQGAVVDALEIALSSRIPQERGGHP